MLQREGTVDLSMGFPHVRGPTLDITKRKRKINQLTGQLRIQFLLLKLENAKEVGEPPNGVLPHNRLSDKI